MSKKSLVIVIALVAVAAALSIVLYNLLKEPEGKTDDGLLIVNEVDPDSVDTIEVESDGGKSTLTREGGGWTYESGEADKLLTEAALTQLSYLYASEVIAESVDEPEKFGLSPPRVKVKLAAGGKSHTYLFGEPSSDMRGYYLIMEGDPRLYLFPAGNYAQIEKAFAAFAPLALDIDQKNLTDIAFSTSGREVALTIIPTGERVGNEMWKLNEPFEATGNPILVSLVETLMTPARLNSYVDGEAPGEYGLEGSNGYLSLTDSGGNSVRLTIGNRAEDGSYYCTVDGREGVYTLYKGYEELFNVEDKNCVSGKVFPLDEQHIESFELTLDGKTLAFDAERSELNGQALDEEQVAGLMRAISGITFDGMTDGAAADGNDGMAIGGAKIALTPYKNEFLSVCRYEGSAPVYVRKDKVESIMSEYID